MGGNTDIVRGIYAAFGEGRIGDIVARFADQTTFVQPGGRDIPWAGTYRTPAEVEGFFSRLAGAVEVTEFTPREYVQQDDVVVALGTWAAVARNTGKPFATSWAMTWKLRDGKVWFYEALEDTDTIAQAFR
jgi:ketosteroid isomerase-like protein